MERSPYPFPLAVNSSHHSHYHRFLLGADSAVLAPLPRPYCVGAFDGPSRALAEGLNLARWRKLYSGSFPWVEGFGQEHYRLDCIAPHRPLPEAYQRPRRRYGAYDLVQAADPSYSALALVAGDRRLIERFVALADGLFKQIEEEAGCRTATPGAARHTQRLLAGQFFEPNNRWLMPFLHVHTRVLNFTSHREAPQRLVCLDPSTLARGADRPRSRWISAQADVLRDLGYRAVVKGDRAPLLDVAGVSESMTAAMQAPRIAVLRILERLVAGGRPASPDRLCGELPVAVIASMAEQIETILARSLWRFKPGKIAIPSQGPWRSAVRQHLSHLCPAGLDRLDAESARARAVPCTAAMFPTPQEDEAHCHGPDLDHLEAPAQEPRDPELGLAPRAPPSRPFSRWLAEEFERTLVEVHEGIVRPDGSQDLPQLRALAQRLDSLVEAASPEQARQSIRLIEGALDLKEFQRTSESNAHELPLRPSRARLTSIDELFEMACSSNLAAEREIGGRCL
jgi:hypothetical protein